VRIFLVGPFYPFRGGIAQYIGVLGKKLVERGHEIRVLSFKKQFPKFLFPGQTQLESSRDHITLDTLPIFIPWNPFTWIKTFFHARNKKADALVFKYWMPFFAPGYAAVCALCKWFSPIKIIFILDNVIPHEKRPGDRFFTRLAFRFVDGFIAQSEVVQADLLTWYPEAKKKRVKLVSHPIYDCYSATELSQTAARKRLGTSEKGRLLLFFGLMRQYKGLDILLKAMPRIIYQSNGPIHLLVAGEFYEPQSHYEELIERLAIQDHVQIINQYIPNEDVSLYFCAADVLVLPYRSATQSGVVQVANNFNVPVISTRVGGLPEVIQDGITGILIQPEDPTGLADAVTSYFADECGNTFRQNIQSHKNSYSWDRMLETIEKLSQDEVYQVA